MHLSVGWLITFTDKHGGAGTVDTSNPRSTSSLLSRGIITEAFSPENREPQLTINGTMMNSGIAVRCDAFHSDFSKACAGQKFLVTFFGKIK